MKYLSWTLLTICIPILYYSNTSAVSETSLSVTPAIIDAPVEAGGSTKRSIEVTNAGDKALPISFEAQAVTIEGELLESADIVRFNAADWVSFEDTTIPFSSGETINVPFSIVVPFGVAPGGYYAQISVRTLGVEGQGDSPIGLVFPELTLPILITVPGPQEELIMFETKNIFPWQIESNKKKEITFSVANTGNIHNLLRPELVLQRGGEEIDRISLQSSVVLPQTRKRFTVTVPELSSGSYRAHLEIIYGSKERVVSSKKESVYSTPPIISVLLAALFALIIRLLLKNRSRISLATKELFSPEIGDIKSKQ